MTYLPVELISLDLDVHPSLLHRHTQVLLDVSQVLGLVVPAGAGAGCQYNR